MKKKFMYLLLAALAFGYVWATTIQFSVTPALPIAATDTSLYVPTAQSTLVINPSTNGQYLAILYNSSGFEGTASPTAAPTMEWVMITAKTRNRITISRAQSGSVALACNPQYVWKLYAAVAGTSTVTQTPTNTFTPTNTKTPTPTPTPVSDQVTKNKASILGIIANINANPFATITPIPTP